MKYLFLILSIISFSAEGSDSWTPREKVLEGTFLTLSVVDWGQTLFIAKHKDYWDHNRIIGDDPSISRVNTVFALELGTHYIIADMLSHQWREPMLWTTIAIRSWAVYQNHQAGIRINF